MTTKPNSLYVLNIHRLPNTQFHFHLLHPQQRMSLLLFAYIKAKEILSNDIRPAVNDALRVGSSVTVVMLNGYRNMRHITKLV